MASTGEPAVHVYGGLKIAMSQHSTKRDIQELHGVCLMNQSSLIVLNFVLFSVFSVVHLCP